MAEAGRLSKCRLGHGACQKCWLGVEMVQKYTGLMGEFIELSAGRPEGRQGDITYFAATAAQLVSC